jgi:hypothetical protein
VLTSLEYRNVSVAIWSGSPSLHDCSQALRAARACHERNSGAPIVLLSVLRPDVRMPSTAVYKKMAEQWPKLLELSISIQCVCLPDGQPALQLLSLLMTTFALVRKQRHVGVYRTLHAALHEIHLLCPELNIGELETLIYRNLR